MKKALVLLAEGSEEIEAVVTIDILTCAGIEVTYVSITNQKHVLCSRGVVISTEHTLSDVAKHSFDVVVLPGGLKGAENLRDSSAVIEKIKKTQQEGGVIAAICAAPALVLISHDLFPGAKMTGFPTTKKTFPTWSSERACYDKTARLITSQGPGTSFEFALKIIAVLLDKMQAQKVAKQLVLPSGMAE